MQREIKFRAWDKHEKKWRYFTLEQILKKTGADFIWDGNDEVFFDSLEEWKQYTGLKDKNGKEIYEGDIIEYDKDFIGKPFGGNSYRLIIVFQHGGFLIQENENQSGGFNGLYAHSLGLSVIGNIYENSELLNN